MRVLLVGMSEMLSSIIRAVLAHAPDIVVASQLESAQDVASEVHATSANAVIVLTNQPGATGSFLPLLGAFPALKVVSIDGAAGSGFVHELRLCSIPITEFSADVLLSALRAQSDLSTGV